MYNFVNCLQFNIRYEKVEHPAPVGGALVYFSSGGSGIRVVWTHSSIFFINSCQIVLMKYFFLITDLVYRGPMEDLEKEHRKLSQTLELYLSKISDRESEIHD
jgi:hypothetical protein